jgi:hypothetical protein
MELKPAERKTLNWLAPWGAATVKRTVLTCGPRVNWSGLIDGGLVRVYRGTALGDVLGLTRAGRDLVAGAVYLNAPSTVTDRAFALEAVLQLEAQGYERNGMVYKPKPAGDDTDVAVRYRLKVPADEYGDLRDQLRNWRPFDPTAQVSVPALGYPSLYASVSGGGLTAKRVTKLLTEHAGDISVWCHPLLVAVPEETPPLRRLLRRLEWERENARAGLGDLRHQLMTYDKLQLVIVTP